MMESIIRGKKLPLRTKIEKGGASGSVKQATPSGLPRVKLLFVNEACDLTPAEVDLMRKSTNSLPQLWVVLG
jgi:hypothetical protein